MLESYLILTAPAEGEIVEKISRFIAQAAPVQSEEEAYAFIEKIKKKHYDARHNCFAFSVGGENPLLRFSDDGEPQGTAGKPILAEITGADIHNICIVVTRYFGGTLLGTGGLVRAYSEACKEALKNAETHLMQRVFPCRLTMEYTDMGKVQYILAEAEIPAETEYAEQVLITVKLPVAKKDEIIKKITEATAARAVIDIGDEEFC